MRFLLALSTTLLILSNSYQADAADLTAFATINCDRGKIQARLNCLNLKVTALTQRLDQQSVALSVFTDEGLSSKREYVRYGDRITISKDGETCLHSGLFAGFGKCNHEQATATGYSLHFRLDKPVR